MKSRLLLTLLACSVTTAFGQTQLTDTDRQLLLEKLKKIQKTSKVTVKGRFGAALSAFRTAASSDAAAHELYVKCIEKVRFQDEAKKAQEFRDWKRRHKDRTDGPAFRRALRHQLSWLVTMLNVANDPKKAKDGSDRAKATIAAILNDSELLKGRARLLQQPVLKSVFATAYDLDKIKAPNWPTSPLPISSMYEQLIMPPLRKPKSLNALRTAWTKRIEHEGLAHKAWADENMGAPNNGNPTRLPAFEKWYKNERLTLYWNMEVDLFNNGDQQKSALKMLEHLQKNLSHKLAPSWIKQFNNLIGDGSTAPKSKPTEETKPT